MSGDQWHLLYEQYQAEILEQAGIIKKLREENAALVKLIECMIPQWTKGNDADMTAMRILDEITCNGTMVGEKERKLIRQAFGLAE